MQEIIIIIVYIIRTKGGQLPVITEESEAKKQIQVIYVQRLGVYSKGKATGQKA